MSAADAEFLLRRLLPPLRPGYRWGVRAVQIDVTYFALRANLFRRYASIGFAVLNPDGAKFVSALHPDHDGDDTLELVAAARRAAHKGEPSIVCRHPYYVHGIEAMAADLVEQARLRGVLA